MMRNLYLTLPSSAPDFADNTTASYRVKLPNPIELVGEWEIALVEIQYPYSWNNVKAGDDADNWIIMFAGENWIPVIIKIPPGHYNNIAELIAITEQRRLHTIKQWKKNTEESEKNKKDVLEALDSFQLSYDKIRKRAVAKLGSKAIKQCTLGLQLQYMFGFDRGQSHGFEKSKNFAKYPPDLTAGFNTLFVYCDIVEHQIVGSSLVPLLRTVPIEGSFGQSVDRNFLSPHYINLRTNSFDTIQIKICRDTGELVHFNFGKIILKVHLRKRQ